MTNEQFKELKKRIQGIHDFLKIGHKKMELKEEELKTHDPDFWNVWKGKDEDGASVERKSDWKSVVDDWQQG